MIVEISKKNTYIHAIYFVSLCFLIVGFFVPKQLSAMSIGIDIPEKYSSIIAGEKIFFETSVKWPENDTRKDLRIEYSVKNSGGEEIAYLKVLKAIETQASFYDSISIPENAKKGMYRIVASFDDYKDLTEDVVASFYVSKGGDATTTYLLIITGIISIVLIFVLIELFLLIRKHKI